MSSPSTDPRPAGPAPLARALGRIPTGLYVVSTAQGAERLGFVGSLLMQVGLNPPVVCVAIGKSRAHLAAVRSAGHFGVSILDAGSQGAMKAFFKPPAPGTSAFDALPSHAGPLGSPLLSEALAWLDCRYLSEHELPDHVVVFGTVEAGGLVREGEPSIHLRKNGLDY